MALQDSLLKPSVFRSPSVNAMQDYFFSHPNSINTTDNVQFQLFLLFTIDPHES